MWSVFIGLEFLGGIALGLRGPLQYLVAFLLPPHVVASLAIVTNLWLWRKKRECSDYRTEVDVIAFVERNASFFLIGSSAVFLFASFAMGGLGLRFPFQPFIFYETLSLVFLSIVLLLYWIPYTQRPMELLKLRHYKTVPFIYAVSFFLAALMIIATSGLSP